MGGSFSFAISTWSPAHGILTIFTIIGNVSNLQREIPCLPSAYNLRFPHRIYPVDKSTLYSRSVNCMCSWTLWVLAGLVITPPLPSPNANLAAQSGPPRPIAKRHTLADGAGGAIDLFEFCMTQFEKDSLYANNIMESFAQRQAKVYYLFEPRVKHNWHFATHRQ